MRPCSQPIPRPRAAVLVLFLLWSTTLACPGPEPEPEAPPEDDPPFDPSVFEIIEYDLTVKDGEGYRGVDDAERVFHAQRFPLDTPMRIHAVGAMFNVRGNDSLPAHLALFPDNGHNFFDFGRDAPLAEWDLDLEKDEHDEVWQVFPLEEPLDIAHPQLLYVGSHYQGVPGQPVLAADETVSLDPYLLAHGGDDFPPHVAVLPDRGTGSGGFETVYFAGAGGPMQGTGDLMVRLYVERYNLVGDGDTWFTDATEDPAIGLTGSGSIAFGDCNSDGWEDVWDGRLRVNNGDGTFSDLTDSSGIGGGGAGTWGDYNNDGRLDLFLTGGADRLYEAQGDCLFVDVTAASGIDDTQLWQTDPKGKAVLQHVDTPAAAWADVDNDGLLDLVQANFLNFTTGDAALDFLWINQGNGLFVNGTDDAGMLSPQGAGKAGRGVAPADWDNDGDTDIYISNYRLHRNFAWENQGDGSFENIGPETGLEGEGTEVSTFQYYYGHTIGSVWGDVDNDGDLDLFAANLAHPRFIAFSNKSMFLRNNLVETGEAGFDNLREEAGMLYQETDSSPVFLDFDNDGLLDLFYTAIYAARPSYLYRNLGDFRFEMVSYPAGAWIYNGWGVSAADVDNDGDLDLYGGRFLRNDHPKPGNWLKVRVVGSGEGGTNRAGIGVRILLENDEGIQIREVSAGHGVGCAAPLVQHFGLGASTSADIQAYFPGSQTVVAAEAAAGQTVVIHEDGSVEAR